jgi:XapX domain-containing protein
MNTTLVVLSLLTGTLVGAIFAFFGVPIPAPPKLAGVMGIVGIFLGYRVVRELDVGFDLLAALGIG